MMRYFRLAGWLFLLFLLLPSAAFSSSPEKAYQQVRSDFRRLEASPAKQRYRENWDRVIEGFTGIAEKYPGHRRAPDALYMAAKTCEGLYSVSRVPRDAQEAVELYDKLASQYPEDSLADDALVRGAAIEEKVLKDYPQAFLRYDKVRSRYSSGDMIAVARRKLAELARFAPPPTQKPSSQPDGGGSYGSSPGAGKGSAELTGIRFWTNPGYTRVVMDLTKKVVYSANFLPAEPKNGVPPRIYVDLKKTNLDPKLSEPTPVDDGLLRRIRTGISGDGTVRVVFDLVNFKDYKVFPLEDPFRLVVDVAGDGEPALVADKPEVRSLPPGPKDRIAGILDKVPTEAPLPVHIPHATVGRGLRRIVVDAGHGGKDPGAIGPDGIREKDVTLAIARVLAKKLEKELGCQVIMTRNSDVYLDLAERTAIANKVGADLFISVHANASPSRQAYGIETYYLNFSKNDQATAVVARENGTTLKQVGDLERILFDLMANSKINESSRLAAEIQKSLVGRLSHRYSHIKDLGVRQGPFYVLLGATMPSVLVETAFISNPREESRLTNPHYYQAAAAAIVKGVHNYATAVKLIASK
jgi:N-acetylmuramoyl-L-alanine amidase